MKRETEVILLALDFYADVRKGEAGIEARKIAQKIRGDIENQTKICYELEQGEGNPLAAESLKRGRDVFGKKLI